MLLLYRTMMRQQLEYGVWFQSPHYIRDVEKKVYQDVTWIIWRGRANFVSAFNFIYIVSLVLYIGLHCLNVNFHVRVVLDGCK